MRYIHHLRAKSYHINRFGDVSTSFLFWYMQEIAWEHAKVMGFGFDDLREDELFWVLSRFYVRIDRRPRWTEEFTLETWSRGTDGFLPTAISVSWDQGEKRSLGPPAAGWYLTSTRGGSCG